MLINSFPLSLSLWPGRSHRSDRRGRSRVAKSFGIEFTGHESSFRLSSHLTGGTGAQQVNGWNGYHAFSPPPPPPPHPSVPHPSPSLLSLSMLIMQYLWKHISPSSLLMEWPFALYSQWVYLSTIIIPPDYKYMHGTSPTLQSTAHFALQFSAELLRPVSLTTTPTWLVWVCPWPASLLTPWTHTRGRGREGCQWVWRTLATLVGSALSFK